MEENRIKQLEQRIIEINNSIKKKKLNPSFNEKRKLTTGNKKPENVAVIYLTRDYQIRFELCRIISGNLVVVNNKVHILNPRAVYRWKKYNCYVIREIDRQPVSNEDIDEVIARKDDTEADVPLIKAVLGAIQKQQQTLGGNKWIIWVIVAVIALIVGYIFFVK